MFLLTACDEVNYFSVEVFTSDSRRGNVEGPNKTSSIAEGKDVELKATDLNGEFICWIKNSNQVVSTNANYTFTMNGSTAGSYTALFSENSPELISYAALTSASVRLTGISQMNIRVNLTPSSSTTQVQELYNGEVTSQNTAVYNGRVFSFRNESMFILSVSVEYQIIVGGVTNTQTLPINNLQLSENEFTENSITITDQDNIVSLTFEKLSKNLVSSI